MQRAVAAFYNYNGLNSREEKEILTSKDNVTVQADGCSLTTGELQWNARGEWQ